MSQFLRTLFARPIRKPAAARLGLESLDERVVPATLAFDSTSGTLSLVGTSRPETVKIERVGNDIRVSFTDHGTGQTGSLSRHHLLVRQVNIDVRGGNDRVENWTSVATQIRGGEGNDVLIGGHGADVLFGEGGDDILKGLGGNDVYDGGTGTDRLLATGPNLRLKLASMTGEGNDLLRDVEEASLTGTSAADTLDARGWAGKALLYGLGGNDFLYGGDGDDHLVGGDGDDRIEGGAGDDNISGGIGNDDLYGNDGDDTIDGGDGNDDLNGGAGDDFMTGGAGSDEFVSGTGRDKMYGGTGQDWFWDINAFYDEAYQNMANRT